MRRVTSAGRDGAVPACDGCLRRTALVAAVAGALDVEWRRHAARARVLALPDAALASLDESGRAANLYERFDAAAARRRCGESGLLAVCRCAARYPARLHALEDPPAVLHVAGDVSALERLPAVAVVGARRATSYGLEVARALGRGLAGAGIAVVSGLALGVDSAAHAGALEAAAAPVAVLAGGADVPYPARSRGLHAGVRGRGCVVSELPPGFRALRWCFVARNRLIAALAELTVVVEAAERSGSLTTADFALACGRTVAAVPGPVTSPRSSGTNGLLKAGAELVRDPGDVLDLLGIEAGARGADPAAGLPDPLRTVLDAVGEGRGTPAALAGTPGGARAAFAALCELELRGLVRREFGGRYVRTAV